MWFADFRVKWKCGILVEKVEKNLFQGMKLLPFFCGLFFSPSWFFLSTLYCCPLGHGHTWRVSVDPQNFKPIPHWGTRTWPTDSRLPSAVTKVLWPDWGRKIKPDICPPLSAPFHSRWAVHGDCSRPYWFPGSPWTAPVCHQLGAGWYRHVLPGNIQSLHVQLQPSSCLCTGHC